MRPHAFVRETPYIGNPTWNRFKMSPPAAPSPAPTFSRSAVLQPGSGFVATFRALWPYLWPADRADLRRRVVLAFALLVAGRVVLMGVPFAFKWATDALANTPSTLQHWLPWLVGAPLALTVIYGLARVGSAAFIQLRDALFAPVFMHAVRTLALQTFGHLHHLSLRFHLERKSASISSARPAA
jgi:ATP-binding cassette subfamily B protein